MKNLKTKLAGGIILFVLLIITPLLVFATNEKVQIICINENLQTEYIVYVQDMADKDFKYAVSNDVNSNELNLNFINAVEDDEGNKVALIDNEKYEQLKNGDIYLWVKDGDTKVLTAEKLNLTDSFEKSKMSEVENTTKRIETKVIEIEEKNEEVNEDGVKVTIKTGGLEIIDSKDATYYFERTKLPAEKYSTLMELAEKINTQYEDMQMYERIEISKEFYNLYTELIQKAKWTEVQDMKIPQPNDAQDGDQYVVFLKKVDADGEETLDAKLLTSARRDEEEKEPERTETVVTKETTKLPITYDSIALIVIFAVIIIALILVFIRMKKLNKNSGND